MAYVTADTKITEEKQRFIARFFTRLASDYEAYAYKKSRRAQIEALEAKSDEELAKLGVKREDIAFFVFSDMFYA
jgi:uncharacterized protein YjiS (DUF1127 family)